MEALQANVERLNAYKSKLVVFPKSGKAVFPKCGKAVFPKCCKVEDATPATSVSALRRRLLRVRNSDGM